MGYSTRYKLSWTPTAAWKEPPLCSHAPPRTDKFCKECGRPNQTVKLDEIVGDYIEEREDMSYALTRTGETNDSCKWYEHEEHLAEMSKAIPGVVFHLTGVGEEAGDIWDAFALDGEVQKHPAQIVRVESPKPWKRSAKATKGQS